MRNPEQHANTPEFAEGQKAADAGQTFRDHCPYTFERTGPDFDRTKLDAWFAGWRAKEGGK